MTPEDMMLRCCESIMAGQNISLTLRTGEKWPIGWPRGELLSENALGRNYSFDPLKILAFMQKLAKLKDG